MLETSVGIPALRTNPVNRATASRVGLDGPVRQVPRPERDLERLREALDAANVHDAICDDHPVLLRPVSG
jgi:hypothetical protein